jgi:photosystem II stability/assembly factor-like uncharacterized protein
LIGLLVVDRDTIVGSTDAGNMARSTDGGRCWSAASLDKQLAHRMGEFARDPRRPNVMIAGSGSVGRVGIGSTTGLLRSGDAGKSWQQLGESAGLPSTAFVVSSLIGVPSGLYIAVECNAELSIINETHHPAFQCGAPVYRSTDGGLSWKPAGLGQHIVAADQLPSPYEGSVQALASLGVGTLFAAVVPLRGKTGLYRSDDNGASWRIVAPEQRLGDTTVLFVSNQAGPTLLAGAGIIRENAELLRTGNGGRTWQSVVALSKLDDPLVVGCAQASHVVFCAGLHHVLRSLDDGMHWLEPHGIGLPPSNITFLASFNGALYLSRVGGLFRSNDAGEHWQRL